MITRSRRLIAVLKAIFTVMVWGASFIATKLALREVSPVVVIWLRFGISFWPACGLSTGERQSKLRLSDCPTSIHISARIGWMLL